MRFGSTVLKKLSLFITEHALCPMVTDRGKMCHDRETGRFGHLQSDPLSYWEN